MVCIQHVKQSEAGPSLPRASTCPLHRDCCESPISTPQRCARSPCIRFAYHFTYTPQLYHAPTQDAGRLLLQVVHNLNIARIEFRGEDDASVRQYTHARDVQVLTVKRTDELRGLNDLFRHLLSPIVSTMVKAGLFYNKDPLASSRYAYIQAKTKLQQDTPTVSALCRRQGWSVRETLVCTLAEQSTLKTCAMFCSKCDSVITAGAVGSCTNST